MESSMTKYTEQEPYISEKYVPERDDDADDAETLEHKREVKRMIENKLEKKRLRDELKDDLDDDLLEDEFNWDDS
jgi:hypothetical protein